MSTLFLLLGISALALSWELNKVEKPTKQKQKPADTICANCNWWEAEALDLSCEEYRAYGRLINCGDNPTEAFEKIKASRQSSAAVAP